jgi:hypothetical protein
MRNHLSLHRISVLAMPIAGAMLMLPVSAAMAQIIPPDVAAIYNSSHTMKTSINGVSTFANKAPLGFDPTSATPEQLAKYGVPPAPPKADVNYAKWAKAAAIIATGKPLTSLKTTKFAGLPAKISGPIEAGVEGLPTKASSLNWSGIINTVPSLTKKNSVWNAKTSIQAVFSDFNVPVAQQAFGNATFPPACDGDDDIAVSWNGIDGWYTGGVLQGGSFSEAFCTGGVTTPTYFGWIEWFPSYPILAIAAVVNPGDDFFVETFNTGPTNGYVCVSDLTQPWGGCFFLTPITGPVLVGNSAEYIVERPGGDTTPTGLFPLMNYVQNYWANSYAYPFTGAQLYPASTASSTLLVTMYDDSGNIPISSVAQIGSKYQMLFENENCSYQVGCVP